MLTDLVTLREIENDIVTTCERIHKGVSTADDDMLLCMMEDLAQLAYFLHHFACETEEWTCFTACVEYRESLDGICRNLFHRLMSN